MQRWLDAGFSPSQFLLLTTDELAERPAQMMRKVERFLGLPVREPEPKPAHWVLIMSHENPSLQSPMPLACSQATATRLGFFRTLDFFTTCC